MKRFLLILGLVSSVGFAQLTKEDVLNNDYYSCGKTNNLKLKKLLKLYPLNITSKIKLVSFEYYINFKDDESKKSKIGLPKKDNKLIIEELKENKTISLNDSYELLDLLYNYGVKPKKDEITEEGASCFSPRNAIVFLNDKDEIIEYIEICFSCGRLVFPEKIKILTHCEGKVALIKSYFIKLGMNYGPNFKY